MADHWIEAPDVAIALRGLRRRYSCQAMSGEKSEEPTTKRLAEARKRGDVARSRDLVAFFTLAAAYAAATMFGAAMVGRLRAIIVGALRLAGHPESAMPGRMLHGAAGDLVAITMPVAGAMMVVGTLVAFLDAGPVLSLSRVLPKLERLDPVKGASQLFSRDRLIELVKSVAAMAALFGVAAVTLMDSATSLARLGAHGAPRGLAALGELTMTLIARSLVVLLGLGVTDFILSRRQHTRSLRMTKDEIKREYREADGDPRQKSERARMHREILEHSVLESVRLADVLIVNPTHLAVALRFDVDSDQSAPEVIAKGEDSLAKRMIEAAQQAGVPVMRDIPLARSLYELEL